MCITCPECGVALPSCQSCAGRCLPCTESVERVALHHAVFFSPQRALTENERHLRNLLSWRERDVQRLRDQLAFVTDNAIQMQDAISRHHQARGHDRCWENDVALYRAVGLEPDDPAIPSEQVKEYMR